MPKWYFSKERLISRTPSRANGVDFTTESRYRREGCRFIMDMGNKLGLRYDTMATGVIYFHRFYMKQSFNTFPRWVTACACLFLAGKVEETPKKCRDIIKVAKSMLSDHHFQLFGENPREEVMMYERVLLQTIKFDLQVDHPYAILLKIGKLLKGDKGKVQKLVQMAWTFVNDSLATNLCIRTKPEILAIAHLNLAGKLANFDLKSSTDSPSNKPWWLVFNKDCSETVVEEICNEMLELYGGKKKDKPSKTKEKIMNDKGEPSPNTSSTTSSPSVTNSPPFKKQRISSTSKSVDAAKPTPPIATSTSQPNKDTVELKAAPVISSQPVSVQSTSTTSASVVEPPMVENISPAIVSDSLPVTRTTSYTISSTTPSMPVPNVVLQPPLASTSYMNTVVPPHNTFLSQPYPATAYSMMPQSQGAETIIPTSTNSSFLSRGVPPVDPLYQPNTLPPGPKPSNYGQSYSSVPSLLPSARQPPPHQPPPHQPPPHQPPPHQPPPHQPPPHQPPLHQPPLHQPPLHQPPLRQPPPRQPPPRQPHPIYPPHHALPPQQNPPPPRMNVMPRLMNSQTRPKQMNNQLAPNQSWHSPYSRPPLGNPPRGGWLR